MQCMEGNEVCTVWRSMQYALCGEVCTVWRSMQYVEKYAVCSVCAGGVWRQLDDRQRQTAAHPPLPYLLAQLDCSTFPRKVFTRFSASRHKSDFWSLSSCVWEEDKGVTESHTDAVLDRLTYDGQEEEKEGNTHTSPSILCSWDCAWLPAKPTMRASTPRAAKALRAPTIFTASARAGLMACPLHKDLPLLAHQVLGCRPDSTAHCMAPPYTAHPH